MPEIEEMRALMQRRFDPSLTNELDATIEFDWGDDRLRFAVSSQTLTINNHQDGNLLPAPECTVFFGDFAVAKALVSGKANPITAFMQGQLRSDSHLLWVFHALAAFSRD